MDETIGYKSDISFEGNILQFQIGEFEPLNFDIMEAAKENNLIGTRQNNSNPIFLEKENDDIKIKLAINNMYAEPLTQETYINSLNFDLYLKIK